MSRPSVSAVVPTRNRPEDVRRCLRSLLATDVDEIVMVDQSTDDLTRRVLDEIGATADDRLVYVASDERGVSRARNTAVRACSGEVIAFTDDDCTVTTTWADEYRSRMGPGGYDLLFAPVAAPAQRSAD